MLFANDYHNTRVHIDDTQSNKEYFCPFCGAPLITKKGELRMHHFAHKATHLCADSWTRKSSHTYDLSAWHAEWQAMFPKENQEIMLALGETKHRADVMIDRTVIEFQHSLLSSQAFDDRNNFYYNFGNKVVWLFDLSVLLESGQLIYKENSEYLTFYWKNPKRAFNSYDVQAGCIDLFFQFGGADKCIVRVLDVSEKGFEQFDTSGFMTKEEFLCYVGLTNGHCLSPARDDIAQDKLYQAFKEKYRIKLNKQQERAMLAVEGAVLLLAVPGSGKTTVLVSRLGHMIINKCISPDNILAITYSNQAAEEMRERFSHQFGTHIGNRIDFRTINSLAYKVYLNYCHKKQMPTRTLIQDKDRRSLIAQIYRKHNDEVATESDIQALSTAIEYIKNMMLSESQIIELESELPHLNLMYQDYQQHLKEKKLMDFDDQMVFALWILENDNDILNNLRNKYKYISVDEAQDTSKIQHRIIWLLAEGNNLFMVGDEDQSIYGFRGAYPRAFLNFRCDYKNPYILRMERNYRSTKTIVDKAQAFISRNKGRYVKNMTAERGEGEEVHYIPVKTLEEQYAHLLNVARASTGDTAFLYRDNESAVLLVDLLTRNNIAFQHRAAEMNFFRNKIVQEIVAYLKLALNKYDFEALKCICNKGIFYLKGQQLEYAQKECERKRISVIDALEKQMKYLPYEDRDRAENLRCVLQQVANSNPSHAIQILLDAGYRRYVEEKRLDTNKIFIMLQLAKREPTIDNFLRRLQELENMMSQDFPANGHNKVILSTIHTSKGMEYDKVYMVDVFDGRFPSSRPFGFSRSKDDNNGEQEERRLFYVGITRAKNALYLFGIKNKPSQYISELFPRETKQERIREEASLRPQIKEPAAPLFVAQTSPTKHPQIYHASFSPTPPAVATRVKDEYLKRRDSVKHLFVQQETQILDNTGQRWVRCEICGCIKEDREFTDYGGKGRVNSGQCASCLDRQNR